MVAVFTSFQELIASTHLPETVLSEKLLASTLVCPLSSKGITRRIQEIEDREDQEKDDETRRTYEEHKKKTLELEKKRMKIIHEKDEKLKKYIAEKRSDAEKSKKEKRSRQNSDVLINSGKDPEGQLEKIRKLELLLKEETKRVIVPIGLLVLKKNKSFSLLVSLSKG